jgi:uncharacterized protein (UPF0333 family)
MKKRGQVALEYMLLIGFLTMVVISLIGISMYYSKETETTINTNQIDKIAKEIVDNAESVYYFGEPSKSTIKIFIPQGVKSINITPREINFRVLTTYGETDIFYQSTVNITGNISPAYGFHYVTIEAREGYVWLNGS